MLCSGCGWKGQPLRLAYVQVKYDTFVTVYMSDCDFYPRVRAAGFETLNYPQVRSPLHGLLQQPMLVTITTV